MLRKIISTGERNPDASPVRITSFSAIFVRTPLQFLLPALVLENTVTGAFFRMRCAVSENFVKNFVARREPPVLLIQSMWPGLLFCTLIQSAERRINKGHPS